MEFKSPQLVPRLARLAFSFQLYCHWRSSGSSFDVCWLVPLSQAPQTGMVPECGMLNHHLAGLLGLGCLSWAGHQITSLCQLTSYWIPGSSKDIPYPKSSLNSSLMASCFPVLPRTPFWTLNWGQYSDFLHKGGLNPVTGSLANGHSTHHLALAVLFIVAGHNRTNWGRHSLREIENHKGPLTGERSQGLYENLTSWHAQLELTYAGFCYIIVAHHAARDLSVHRGELRFPSLPPHVDWCLLHRWWSSPPPFYGAGLRSAVKNNLLDRVLRHRDAIISHLNWVCMFLGYSFGLYIPMTMQALGRPKTCSRIQIQLQPVSVCSKHQTLAPGSTPNQRAC